ncbi:MAG: protein-export membrane protein SecF [Candidatus Woykebacteria bacterium RBG_13_40_7b]|uniref:Protein-export membrane protein SecF n=1 Tax=Candidatus Woykebacteria bacterium RBG_13_40_7b TaxID=1802594 RepID=A0A1G1WA12_9BACT|nr:MAG: protein-export membrane protein SecF [Candidatus Woykebacteria bacterium RBG_13_40_7b]
MLDIVGKKFWYFAFSALIILPGSVSLVLYGLKLGIDFTGGSLLEVRLEKQVTKEELQKSVSDLDIEVASVSETADKTFLLRTKPLDVTQDKKVIETLNSKYEKVTQLRLETVGPTIGAELLRKALLAVVVASIGIVLYIAFAFREVPKPASSIRFGICAVIALLHDVLVVVGIFSILGKFFSVEIDSLFVTALLTVIGFSVHDTIVVFDRIRENLKRRFEGSFPELVNHSIMQTIARSLNTSLTVVFVLLALLLFGGTTIRWFIVALLVGIISGTYSSIFNAAPLLVLWHEINERRRK